MHANNNTSLPHQHLPKPHIFVFPFIHQGHITPMMHLSKKLVAHGCVVTFVNTEYNHKRIISTLSQDSLEQLGIRLESVPDGLPPDFDRVANLLELDLAVTKLGKALEEVIEKAMHDPEWGPVTCIVSDVLTLVTQDAANKFGIPRVALWTQSAAAYASHLYASKGFRPPLESSPQIPGVAAPVKFPELSNFLHSIHGANQSIYDFFVDPFHRMGEAAWILMNTFEELESSEVNALEKEREVLKVGPLLPSSFFHNGSQPDDGAPSLWQPEQHCLHWLDGHAPSSVLYVSFGSVTAPSQSEIRELALGLEASEQPFLWVLRSDWMSSDCDVLPEGFKERVGRRGLLISWAPQLQVLSHGSVGGFLTHCGWNSTLESISAGVPMIGRPNPFVDQALNCRYVVEVWKVGLRLEADKDGFISKREVEMKVRSLMVGEEGKEARRRAMNLKATAWRAVEDDGGSSAKDWERFMIWMKEEACMH